MSSTRLSIVGSAPGRIRSDRPMPRRSSLIRRPPAARRLYIRATVGSAHSCSIFVIQPRMMSMSTGPDPGDLVGDVRSVARPGYCVSVAMARVWPRLPLVARARQEPSVTIVRRIRGDEEDRVPLVRTLVGVALLGGAVRVGRAHPVDRARRGGRGSGCRRRLLPGPPLRRATRVAVPAPGGHRRSYQAHRDRHGRHRHALREPLYMVEDAGAADLIAGVACSSASAAARPSR